MSPFRPWTWVYLCTDHKKLRLTLDKMPSQSNLTRMIVLYDDTFGKSFVDLLNQVLADAQRTDLKIDLLSDLPLRDYVFKDVPSVGCLDAMQRYKLFDKICVPLLKDIGEVPHDDALLFTDDDVLVLKDAAPAVQAPFSTTSLADRLVFTNKIVKRLDTWNKAFKLYDTPNEVTMDDFNENKSDAGIWCIHDYDEEYLEFVYRFFNSPEVIQSIRTKESGHNFQRTWDQRFLTMYFCMRNIRVNASVSLARVFIEKYEKVEGRGLKYPWRTIPFFVHYCASTHKDKYMEFFTKHIPNWRAA